VSRRWLTGGTTVSGYHRDIKDAWQRIYAIDGTNPNYEIINKLYGNVGRATQTGVQVVADQQLATPWRLSGGVHWYVHDVDAFEATLLFPTERTVSIASSRDQTWDLSIGNRFRFSGNEVQLNFVTYAARNVAQGRERGRSSLDFSASRPLWSGRGDVTFTFTDMLNDFGLRREVDGNGFRAVYENLLETQVARVRVRVRF
jgi:hypothetical protein